MGALTWSRMAHRPVLVLTHAAWETPALIEHALGTIPTLELSVLDQAEPTLPRASELGGVVVMGGPQDANDDRNHPGLRAERRLLADAVSADIPVLGVCLGMQLTALALGAREAWFVVDRPFVFLRDLFVGRGSVEDLGGVIRIAEASGQAAAISFALLVHLMGVLSISLGLINLMPVPMLDGGHLVFYLIEALRGRPLGAEAQEYGFRIGMVLVLGLMLFATWQDLVHVGLVKYIVGLVS